MLSSKKRKSWLEIELEIPRTYSELVSAFLFGQGCTGFIQEKIGRDKERLIVYFPNERSFKRKDKEISSYLADLGVGTPFNLKKGIILEEKWAEAWKSNFKPVKVSPRLVVKPPWEKYKKRQGEIVLQIKPGMAFGTGTHQTTQMCLKFLDNLIPQYYQFPIVLDVGTGSGILAIAALKLGAKKVQAIDIDRLALQAAKENARLNKIYHGINFRLASPDQVPGTFDLVVANLLPQELIAVKDSLAAKVETKGALIIAGFLQRQKKEIYRAFAQYGFHIWQTKELNGWVSFVLKKMMN